jgi:HAMP domain-containing protein
MFTDVDVVRTSAATVSQPRVDEADSFVLHAPLELAARLALLPWVDHGARPRALDRIADVGHQFAASGPNVEPPKPREGSLPHAARHLVDAIAAGDLDDVDAWAAAFAEMASPDDLVPLLGDALVPSLAAAGHAPIFLYLVPRVAPRGELPLSLLRPLARDLAWEPGWRLRWFEQPHPPAGLATMREALQDLPLVGVEGSTSIHPLMSRVEAMNIPATHLTRALLSAPLDQIEREITRLAATAMLVEPDDHVPYGWTHALTMTQAVLAIGGRCSQPHLASAVGATFFAGFRCALGTDDLREPFDPPPVDADLAGVLRTDPRDAAAAAWHASDLAHVRSVLATEASIRHDAHLVKYTLACLDAAVRDRDAERLYLAAAARLLAWWVEHPHATD